ncbi:hypothetical protein B0T18DRAFT_456976 [Schizothecium vesticola]|uniref:Uncharacterized protein n=1 Tax=Schizothecium vesticola TaxID=314040 RepID=A0AA40KAD2_9PEZI|nr:hypothetical protein B0T18DRAFT_456976 [Schizothecium vesticola]
MITFQPSSLQSAGSLPLVLVRRVAGPKPTTAAFVASSRTSVTSNTASPSPLPPPLAPFPTPPLNTLRLFTLHPFLPPFLKRLRAGSFIRSPDSFLFIRHQLCSLHLPKAHATMETESLVLDWVEEHAPLTPPQSDKGDQDNGTLPNGVQDNLAMIQDMATQAFVLKLEGVQDIVLSSYHRIFSDGFLEGWKYATAMSTRTITADTIAPFIASTPSDMAAKFLVSSPIQSATIIPDMTSTPINTTIVDLEAGHTPFDTTISTIAAEQTPIEKFDNTIDSTDTLINTDTLIDLTPPDNHRPYPFLPSPHTNPQRPYIPTIPLYGIPPPCDIIPIFPSLSPTPTPPYPNLLLPASFDTPSSSSNMPSSSSATPPPPPPSACLLTSSHPTTSLSHAPAPLPSLLLGPISPASLLDWATTTPEEPHAYFAEKLGGGSGGDRIIHSSEYLDEVDTGARYIRLTFWEAGAAERAAEVFRGGYSCGGGVVWGWVWRG